jgi:hypothetical protein
LLVYSQMLFLEQRPEPSCRLRYDAVASNSLVRATRQIEAMVVRRVGM